MVASHVNTGNSNLPRGNKKWPDENIGYRMTFSYEKGLNWMAMVFTKPYTWETSETERK